MNLQKHTSLLTLEKSGISIDDDQRTFTGYASVFGGLDAVGDTIVKGAYADTIKEFTPKLFVNHQSWELPVGKWIDLQEDDIGLKVTGQLTKGLGAAEDIYAAMKHGTIDGLSVGGLISANDYTENSDGTRVINKWTKLIEISIVTFPADNSARIDMETVKSALDSASSLKEFEEILRDAGFSKSAAKAFVSRTRQFSERREDEHQDETATKSEEQLAEIALRLRLMGFGK